MVEILHQISSHLRALWMYRWLGFIGAALVALIGMVAIWQVPDKFEASARVYVDTQSILQPLMAGLAIQPNVDQQVDMLSRTLISHPNVEKLVHMADLDLKVKSPAEKEALIDQVTSNISIRSTGRDNLFTLSYRDSVPAVAKNVVQSLTTIFVESNLGMKRDDSSTAQQFINQQITDYEKKLVETETKIKDFKIHNLNLQVGEGKNPADHVVELDQQLQQARMDLSEAVHSRDALQRQLTDVKEFIPQSMSDDQVTTPDLDARIQSLKTNLDGLLQRYTDQHPDVVETRRLIHDLEKQRANEVAARKRASAANPNLGVAENPIFQQIKIALGTAEANVAALQAKVAGISGQYGSAMSALKEGPEREAEYVQLVRDYNITKANYDQLVQRSQSAELSGKVDEVGGMAVFRVIDPPRVSTGPVEPNRLMLLGMVYLISIGVGLAISFVASQLRPVFFDAKTLCNVTELPVLGTVSLLQSDSLAHQIISDRRRFFMALAGLAAVYVLVFVGMSFVIGHGI